ncbi:unnamed protein product [Adineta steineri]|uniref:Uncharacterized protein n=2 Tax=Adineta steineri TaxID=433720 RepID=A0A814N4Q7_9BILA|nr:unnamed protein product [Adineta steineri]
MENNAVDIISGLNGTGVNSPTYETPGITGTGYTLKLIRESRQYITIPTYKSFVNTSFTVEMWIYPTNRIYDYYSFGLFTQYDTESPGRSLQMMIQRLKLTLDFYADGVTGKSSLTPKNCLIDQVSLTMAAKSAGDILNDATLASWHSFDSGTTYDSGPNKLHGTAINVTLVPGKVGQGLNFNLDSSYYQVGCLLS